MSGEPVYSKDGGVVAGRDEPDEGSATWWETQLIALRAELEEVRAENFALAADQCDDGYGDEWGNHCCRRVDKAVKDAEELALVANAARALLGEAKEWLWQAIPAEAALRARIAAFLGDAT